MQSLGAVLNGFQRVALRRYGNTNIQIVVSILQEAPVFFVFARFFRIGHGEEVIFIHEPLTQATVFHH